MYNFFFSFLSPTIAIAYVEKEKIEKRRWDPPWVEDGYAIECSCQT